MLKKNEIYRAVITGYTAEGLGVCRVDGQVVFVHGALEGEELLLKVLKVGATQAYGKIEEILTPSPARITPDCPYDKYCGGCALRHMTYAEELRLKADRVRDALNRIGGAALDSVPILGAQTTECYRNKAIFPVASVNGAADAGFYRARSHDLIPVERCKLQSPAADAARAAVVAWMRKYRIPAYDESSHTGLVRHVFVRSAFGTGQVLVCLIVNGSRVPREAELTEALRGAVPGLSTVVLCENTRKGNAILGDRFRTLWGPGTVDDTLCGLTFRLSPRSFYQVNRQQAQRLYDLAISRAQLQKSDTVLDLYCGTGTITLCMARACGRAIGVEIIAEAVADAEENARRNGVENARFFCADAGQAALRLSEEGVRPDVIVVDPPRKGLSPDVIEAAVRMAPRRIVYISCDPATLARDVKLFSQQGYLLRSADAVDLFPRCAHVESVVVLSRETVHEMKLHASPFEMIKRGEKTIELRLLDEKRRRISPGDTVVFTNTATGETLTTTVEKLHIFRNFAELYESLPLLRCGYTPEDVSRADPSDMDAYYSLDAQAAWGVVGIELRLSEPTGEAAADLQ